MMAATKHVAIAGTIALVNVFSIHGETRIGIFGSCPFDTYYHDRLQAYYICDRSPTSVALTKGTAKSDKWIAERWISMPTGYIKKPLVLHDQNAKKQQNMFCDCVEDVRKRLSIAAAEYLARGLDITKIEKICAQERSIMKDRAWKRLRDRGQYEGASKTLRGQLLKLSESTDEAYVDIIDDIKKEFALWASQNPGSAQSIVLMRRVKEAEQAAQDAQDEARAAEMEAAEAKRIAEESEFRSSGSGIPPSMIHELIKMGRQPKR